MTVPVVLMILRYKKSQKVSQKGPEKNVNKCGKLGLTSYCMCTIDAY